MGNNHIYFMFGKYAWNTLTSASKYRYLGHVSVTGFLQTPSTHMIQGSLCPKNYLDGVYGFHPLRLFVRMSLLGYPDKNSDFILCILKCAVHISLVYIFKSDWILASDHNQHRYNNRLCDLRICFCNYWSTDFWSTSFKSGFLSALKETRDISPWFSQIPKFVFPNILQVYKLTIVLVYILIPVCAYEFLMWGWKRELFSLVSTIIGKYIYIYVCVCVCTAAHI